MIDILSINLHNTLLVIVNLIPKLIAALIIFFGVIYVGKIANKLINNILNKSDISDIHFNLYLKISKIFFLFIATILFLNIIGLKSIAAGLFAGGGIITVILGFAFREIGENLFAGILLSFNRPFKKGDFIKSSNFEGTVKAIEIRSTHIRSSDGQDIFVPSSQIYKNTLINYTKDGLRRFSLNIGISYDSDVNLACKIINQEINKIPGVLKTPKASASLNQMLPSYIEIGMSFWVNVFSSNNNVGKIKTDIGSRVKEELLAHNFILSSDTYDNVNFRVVHDLEASKEVAH